MNKHLAPGHWIAIATIAVVVLGGVISVALSEHNARLENFGTRLSAIAGAQTQLPPSSGLVRRCASTPSSNVRLSRSRTPSP